MANAGTVEINFAAETAKFTAELKKVRSDLKSLKEQVNSVSSGFKTAANALKGVFAALAVGTAIRAVVKATEESEAAVAQLNNALKSSGAVVGPASQKFQEFATQMQRITTFSDESVMGVEALLLRFKGLGGQTVLKATSAVLDLSTGMRVDLQSAALGVGKALSDPVNGLTALQKAGIRFSDSQKELIKHLVETGDRSKAQAIILAELKQRFDGAAAAARDTFGGALKGVENAFDDLLEAKSGLPGATHALNDLSATLSSPEVKQGFDALILGLTKVIELAAKGTSAVASFGAGAGRAIGRFLFPDSELTAAQALNKELEEREARLKSLRGRASVDAVLGVHELDEQITKQQQYIKTLKQRIALAQEAQPKRDFLKNLVPAADSIISTITGRSGAGTDFITGGGTLEGDAPEALRLKQQKEFNKEFLKQREEGANFIDEETRKQLNDDLELSSQYGVKKLEQEQINASQVLDFKRKTLDDEIEAERSAQETILGFKLNAANAAIGLLQALGSKNKAFAVAALAFETAVAVKRILIQGQVAAIAALTPPPIGLGPVAGVALAAKITALSRISAAITAATGLAQIGQTLSSDRGGIGGTALGTPANPISTSGSLGSNIAAEAESRQVIQIDINGFISHEVIDDMIEQLKDATGRGTIFIRANSNQADEIRRGG